jgi:hypothetical protein
MLTLVTYLFIHDGFETILFDQELSLTTLEEYIEWFIDTYPCLQDWKESMHWNLINTKIDETEHTHIHFETKTEGYTTLCIRNTINDKTLHFPFSSMNYYQLRTIFSLLLPSIDVVFYLNYNNNFYQPKHPFVMLPKATKECMVDVSTYPLIIYTIL